MGDPLSYEAAAMLAESSALRPRDALMPFVEMAGLVPDGIPLEACCKRVVLCGDVVVKACSSPFTNQTFQLSRRLGEDFASVFFLSRWIIVQERVQECPADERILRVAAQAGVRDVKGNCGRREDGRVVLFDGSIIP